MPESAHASLPSSKHKGSALKVVGWLLFVFALFPAVAIIPLPIASDTQPNALLIAVLVFLVGRRVPLPLPVWALLVLLTGASLLFLAEGGTINGMRSLLGYTTVFAVACATLVLAANDIRLSDKTLDRAVYIWTFVGAIQLFLWHPFMTFLVTASRTTEGRGVTSLSNEPSLYATTMVFFVILYFMRRREQSWPVFLCIIQIVLFAQSALGVLFVIMMLGLYALLRLSAPGAVIAVLALLAALFALVMNGGDLLAGTRIGSLLILLKDNPMRVLQVDQSVSTRFGGVFYSIKGAIDNAFVPRGFDVWREYSYIQNMTYKSTFGESTQVDRIMSGYGSALFEMGWVGLTIPLLITVGTVKSMWRESKARAVSFLFVVHLLLLTPVPLTFPLVGMLIGNLFSNPNPSRQAAPALSAKLA